MKKMIILLFVAVFCSPLRANDDITNDNITKVFLTVRATHDTVQRFHSAIREKPDHAGIPSKLYCLEMNPHLTIVFHGQTEEHKTRLASIAQAMSKSDLLSLEIATALSGCCGLQTSYFEGGDKIFLAYTFSLIERPSRLCDVGSWCMPKYGYPANLTLKVHMFAEIIRSPHTTCPRQSWCQRALNNPLRITDFVNWAIPQLNPFLPERANKFTEETTLCNPTGVTFESACSCNAGPAAYNLIPNIRDLLNRMCVDSVIVFGGGGKLNVLCMLDPPMTGGTASTPST